MREGYYIIDCHCHVYPDSLAQKAAENISDFYDGIPHTVGSVSRLLQLMEEQGIDYSLVNSAAMTPKQVHGINTFITETAAKYPKMLGAMGTLHPQMDAAELETQIHFLVDHGALGIKLHPDMIATPLDDENMLKLYSACGEAKLPVLLHTGDKRYDFSNPNRMSRVLEVCRNTQFIGGHFAGRDFYLEASQKLSAYPNLHADCSSSFYWLEEAKALQCIENMGIDKILFGTDFPVCLPNYDLDYFFRLPISSSGRRKILSENAMNLFHLDRIQ